MPQFEELQELWQRQPQPPDAADLAMLRRSLRDYQARLNRIYLLKSIVAFGLIAFAVVWFRTNLAMIAALTVLAAGAAVVLLLDLRDQRAVTRLDFTDVSVGFLRQAIRRAERQRGIFGKRWWFFLAAVAAVENVSAVALTHDFSWRSRLIWHAGATLLPLAACQLGRWVRIRRFERNARPIVERLSAIQRALEGSSE